MGYVRLIYMYSLGTINYHALRLFEGTSIAVHVLYVLA